jgi:glycosyltransferase involved in cell wall biosynthesis
MVRTISSFQIGQRWSSKVFGGSDRVFTDLAATLPGQGIGFTGVVTGPSDLNLETDGLVYSFAPESAGTMARLRSARKKMICLLAEKKPDLLASHFAFYTVPILDRLSERPFIMHFHGPWAMESRVEGATALAVFPKYRLERAVYDRADHAIVLSQAFAALLHKEYGFAEEKISIIPGSVDLDRFAPVHSRAAARDLLQWPKDRPILFSARRLVRRMGLQQLLQALPSIRSRVPDVLLYLAGNGPIRHQLQQTVDSLDLKENVRFLGFLPDAALPHAYRAADLSVVPTNALEGFGLVAAESLAAGTPAMVTPIGGLPEVVKELSENLIFRSGDPVELADGLIAALLGHTRLPTETDCRHYAVERFSRSLMASRVAAVYREQVG